ncbi:transporter substrate-binding domain-containing protein [Pseudomonas sp. UL073]|uniref:Transporter substrate-binding domain-containing protein n=1 Tax=Zestomonas insulae TaxID=2809017 RepID=A0ABS2IBX1_9GAMM|nr:transporter substrate-binding domain-containing protein [Pseudomonas insulae]MBM7060606.1 transporter substrate-binding domain-containing protein [Pseudomonas insulae]
MRSWWIGFLALGVLVAGPLRAETLKVAMEGAFPPFEEVGEDGKLKGFNVDIANALCAQMKTDCELVRFPFDDLIPTLNAKKSDLVLASMSITAERQQLVDFTDKYSQTPTYFFGKNDEINEVFITPRRVSGKRIGVQRGTVYDSYLIDKFAKYAAIERFDSAQEAYDALYQGKVNLVLDDAVSGYMSFLDTPRGEGFGRVGGAVVAPKYMGVGQGIAVRKGDEALKARLNQALAVILSNGTYNRIERQYFRQFSVY